MLESDVGLLGFGISIFPNLRINPSLEVFGYDSGDSDGELVVVDGQSTTLKLSIEPAAGGVGSIDAFSDIFLRHSSSMTLIFSCQCDQDRTLFKDSVRLNKASSAGASLNHTSAAAIAEATDSGISISKTIVIQVPVTHLNCPLRLKCSLHLSVESAAFQPALCFPSGPDDGEEMAMRLLLQNHRYKPTGVAPLLAALAPSVKVIRALQLKSSSVELSPSSSLLILQAINQHPKTSITLHEVTAQSSESEKYSTSDFDDLHNLEGRTEVDVSALYRFLRIQDREEKSINSGDVVTLAPSESFTFVYKIRPRRAPSNFLVAFSSNPSDWSCNTSDSSNKPASFAGIRDDAESDFLWHTSLLGKYCTPISVQWTVSVGPQPEHVLRNVEKLKCSWTIGTECVQSAFTPPTPTTDDVMDGVHVQHSLQLAEVEDPDTPPPVPVLQRQLSGASGASSSSGAFVNHTPNTPTKDGLDHESILTPLASGTKSKEVTPRLSAKLRRKYESNSVNTTPIVFKSPSAASALGVMSLQNPRERAVTGTSTSSHSQHSVSSNALPMNERSLLGSIFTTSPLRTFESPLPGSIAAQSEALGESGCSSFCVMVNGPAYGVVNEPVVIQIQVLNTSNRVFVGLQLATSYSNECNEGYMTAADCCGDSILTGNSVFLKSRADLSNAHFNNVPNIDSRMKLSQNAPAPDFLVSESITCMDGAFSPGEQRQLVITALPLKVGMLSMIGLHIHDPSDGPLGRNYRLLQSYSIEVRDKRQVEYP